MTETHQPGKSNLSDELDRIMGREVTLPPLHLSRDKAMKHPLTPYDGCICPRKFCGGYMVAREINGNDIMYHCLSCERDIWLSMKTGSSLSTAMA